MRKSMIILIILTLLSCKDNTIAPVDMQSVVGKWKLISYKNISTNQVVMVDNSQKKEEYSFEVRYDGALLAANGLGLCCAPKTFTINGVNFTPALKEPVPYNPTCSLVDCIGLSTWQFNTQKDELEMSASSSNATKYTYIRIK